MASPRSVEVRPWAKGLGFNNPQRIKMWQELEAESIAQRRALGMLPPEEIESEPAAVVPPPEPIKPKSKRRKTIRKQQKPPDTPQAKAWHSLHEIRDHLRAERGDNLTD